MTRQEAKNEMIKAKKTYMDLHTPQELKTERCKSRLSAYDMAIETLEQEPKTGHWIKAQPRGCWSYSDVYAECDCCHGEPTFNGWDMKYCPNCGAKMEEKND